MLCQSAADGNVGLVRYLVGRCPELKPYYVEALVVSTQMGYTEVVQDIVEQGLVHPFDIERIFGYVHSKVGF